MALHRTERGRCTIEPLESRRLLAAAFPTDLEQYAVEILNRARANPAAEAARLGVALNEGLPLNTISSAPVAPLAINPFLTDAARRHAQWVIDTDRYGHAGPGNNTPRQRHEAAGYRLENPWASGESIVLRYYSTPQIESALIDQFHADLYIDDGIAGRGHRKAMFRSAYHEVGVGLASGEFRGFTPAAMQVHEFAASGTTVFLTGVAYNDTPTDDNFYTPGEGLRGVTITARKLDDDQTFSTTTWPSGGYSLALPPGTYEVAATGDGLQFPITFSDVTIANENIKRDIIPSDTPPPPDPEPDPDPEPEPEPPPNPGPGPNPRPPNPMPIPRPPPDRVPPAAQLTRAPRLRAAGGRYYQFAVTYTDNLALRATSIDGGDLLIIGPDAAPRYAAVVNTQSVQNGRRTTVTYRLRAPGGRWDRSDNGVYTITLRKRQIADNAGNLNPARVLGRFSVRIPKQPSPPPSPATVLNHSLRPRSDEDPPVFA